MNKTSIVKFAQSLAAASVLAFFVGCGSDESNSVAPIATNSSANVVPASSASVDPAATSSVAAPVGDPLPESSVSVDPMSSATVDPLSSAAVSPGVEGSYGPYNGTPAAITAVPDSNGFYYIADVYKAVPTTSKISFVIRHSERQSCESQESKLTAEGIAHAQALGADIGGDEKFYYTSTDFIRTRETANNIAVGRGETAEVVTWDAINGGYFLKVSSDSLDALVKQRGGSWKNLSQFIYGAPISNAYVAKHIADYVYDIMPRGDQFIKEVVLDNMANWNRVSFLVTHDVLIEPLIVYATNRTIDLKFYESGRWANYMSGVAVVVDAAGAVSLYPVRGYELGWIGATKSTSTCPEDNAGADGAALVQ